MNIEDELKNIWREEPLPQMNENLEDESSEKAADVSEEKKPEEIEASETSEEVKRVEEAETPKEADEMENAETLERELEAAVTEDVKPAGERRRQHREVEEKKPPRVIVSLQEYKDRFTKAQRQKMIRMAVIAGAVAVAVIGGKLLFDHWQYQKYTVVEEGGQEDTLSTQYTDFGDNILKVSGDDVSLLSRQDSSVWNETHEMQNPEVEMCQDHFVVYDKMGSTMTVYNKEGKVGEIQTNLPILKVSIAKQGVVAAVLEDGETTWIKVYSAKGEEIVTAKTRVNSPGYPVDLSLSEDGLLMGVTYLNVTDHKLASYVAFYSFSNSGQNQMDNMVSSYTYKDVLVPQIQYLADNKAVVFRDNGFVIYSGNQIPEERETVEVEGEILSTFCDSEHIGMIFRDTEGEHPYRIELYNTRGRQEWTAGLDIAFDHVEISKDRIILYNDTEFAVYTLGGACRYQGGFQEGNIQNIFKMAGNRYAVVMDGGVEMIKLGR